MNNLLGCIASPELVVQIDEMPKQMNQYRWTMSKI